MKLHAASAFTANPNSLLTEKAGKLKGNTYTQNSISWLINPLLAYAVLNTEDAVKFFQPLPTNQQLANIGHQKCDFNSIHSEYKQNIYCPQSPTPT